MLAVTQELNLAVSDERMANRLDNSLRRLVPSNQERRRECGRCQQSVPFPSLQIERMEMTAARTHDEHRIVSSLLGDIAHG